MRYDKEKYERLIIKSRLFELNKETQYTAFKREAYKMLEYLYCYLLTVNKQKYEPYGCEITELAIRCLNNFSKDKGDFLNYFNAAWKLEYQHIMGEQVQSEKLHGIRITENNKRAFQKYMRLTANIDSDISNETIYANLASAMEISIDKVRELAQLSSTYVSGNIHVNDYGDIVNLWDQLADDFSIDSSLCAREGVEEILFVIEQMYLGLQLRQRPIISDMITIKICEHLPKTQSVKYSFISNEIMETWMKTGFLPAQRDIAKKYGRDETSISRAVKDFINKLRKEVY